MPEWSGWNKAMKAMNGTLDFVKTAIDKHKSNYNEDVKENPKDFIDAFLNQINDKANIGQYQFGYGIQKMVGPQKQDFRPQKTIVFCEYSLSKSDKIVLSKSKIN